MAKQSDKTREVGRISATEAGRSFSRVLDEVEAGRSFVVRRRGQDVCLIAPPPVASRRASEAIAYLRARTPVVLDDRFADDLLDVIAGEPAEERSAWVS